MAPLLQPAATARTASTSSTTSTTISTRLTMPHQAGRGLGCRCTSAVVLLQVLQVRRTPDHRGAETEASITGGGVLRRAGLRPITATPAITTAPPSSSAGWGTSPSQTAAIPTATGDTR